MADKENREREESVELRKRRAPCMVSFLHPFRIVNGPDSKPWEVSIEEVNRSTWDYVALHEVIGGVDVGLKPPYHMIVCRDGAIGLPVLPDLRGDQQAVEFFNRCLAALLVGGFYCEAIALDGLDFGSIIDWKYLRIHSDVPAAPNRFHNHVRLRQSSPLEAISLSGARVISFSELSKAMAIGRSVLDSVPELSAEFLLKGVTGIARRDWGTALASLWIVIEQLTSHLWDQHVLKAVKEENVIPGRVDQLSDSRTWTVAARNELLRQTGVLSHDTLEQLALARKARNELSHKGRHPSASAARAAFKAIAELLKIAVPGVGIPLIDLDLTNHQMSDPFLQPKQLKLEPTHWMEIPKLPGEQELERLEAEHSHGSKGQEGQ